ncbi:XRE family transcriptional regulator [Paenibacillus sp. LHD-117]|uniref:helix-turn-helix domain-containing protein n=1 Tax=Paenibacillus sp. LHD-117 TaxID=3071412 RepID=UPI0027E07B1C|nr:XRE family transcriptional regulator [Paenibacillus sp. LHD-117]MDQ6418131.1 XRE family transcriptional regulator [Paenibacillus sp. LHD-117]
MEHIHKKVGKNLQSIRKARGLSLDQVAELTGVSKAMLGQIERGDSNPTISVLWKIVNGLRISFTSLIEEDEPKISVIEADKLEPFLEQEGHYRVYPMFPYDQRKGFEIYSVHMDPGCSHTSDPHNEGVEEYIIVTSGKLHIMINGDVYSVKVGNAIHFSADQPHSYHNKSDEVITYTTLIQYPG